MVLVFGLLYLIELLGCSILYGFIVVLLMKISLQLGVNLCSMFYVVVCFVWWWWLFFYRWLYMQLWKQKNLRCLNLVFVVENSFLVCLMWLFIELLMLSSISIFMLLWCLGIICRLSQFVFVVVLWIVLGRLSFLVVFLCVKWCSCCSVILMLCVLILIELLQLWYVCVFYIFIVVWLLFDGLLMCMFLGLQLLCLNGDVLFVLIYLLLFL